VAIATVYHGAIDRDQSTEAARPRVAIRLTPFAVGDLCSGSSWQVDDLQLLASQVAAVAVGQSRHIERVLAGARLGPAPTRASAAVGAIAMLTVVGDDPSHRDGWIFQVISWIAAHRAAPGGLIRAPHMQLAHKGFDGLQLELSNDDGNLVTAAIIFEDKATANPRDTIRDEVWPEFADLETGARDNLLTAEVIALLQTRPAVNPEAAERLAFPQFLDSLVVSIVHLGARPDRQRLSRSDADDLSNEL
jgi:hypothetical protein